MTDLRVVVGEQLKKAFESSPYDAYDTAMNHIASTVGRPYQWGSNVTMSRELALFSGVVEPTPQERAVMGTNSARYRVERAARELRRADWFSSILDVAGPIGAAMLNLHTPDRYGDCEGCGFEDMAGLAWPCATVLAGAEAAGVPEPRFF